ncbi:MAG: DUF1993 domain-containing protein [Pseudomonadota bacterium]
MATGLITFIDLYSKGLATLDNLLTKGAAFAKAQGVSEADMFEWRLIDDMHPLRFQANVALNFARQWPARVLGVEIPPDAAGDLDVAGYKAAIAEAKAYLAAIKAEQLDARADAPVSFNLGQFEPTFPASQWLTGFATTNFYFHLSMAYAILRHKGVQIGKPDLFAGGL